MAYERLNLSNGTTFNAGHVKHLEDGIEAAHEAAQEAAEAVSGYATEEFVKNKIAEAELAGGDVDLSGYAQKSELPTKTSQLTNDSGFITDYTETDPTVPDWAKQPKKPSYTADEVGALPDTYTPPVQSVNGKTGAVSLSANDVGAQPKGEYLTEVPAGYATEEFVQNKIAEAKLEGGEVDLSGYATKGEIPTKVSQLQNDSGFMTEFTEADPTVPSWAKQAQKPTYTAAEVGALPASTIIPSKLSDMTEDATHRTVTDAEKTAWNAKGSVKTVNGASPDAAGNVEIAFESEDIGITRVESMDTSNLVNLRDLETGPYVLYGYFSPYANSDMSMTFDNTIVIVARKSAGSHLLVLTGLNSKINFLEILVDETAEKGFTYSRTDFNLLDMHALIEKVGILDELTTAEKASLVAAINEVASGKLDADKLPQAVNDALAQAKASGEFDGAKGDKGDTGAAGKTPVKGVDYWTEADQEAIVQQVIAALGTPVFGRVDAENNIILTGELADGTYTIKYEDSEGNQTAIGTLTEESVPTYTNILPSAINSDNTLFVGANGEPGYKTGYRLNSSGAEAAVSDWEVTGFIPISTEDTLYFKNIQIRGNSQKHDYIGLYNASFTTLTSTQVISVFTETTLKNAGAAPEDYGITLDADDNLVSIDFKKLSTTAYGSVSVAGWANVKYIRFSCFGITDESIITKNEPIE